VIFAYTPAGVTTYRPEIAIFGGISIPAGWLAVDTTTSGAQTIYDHKDTVAYGGTNLFFTTHLESQNLADTSVTVAGKAYNAFRWRTRTTVEAKVEFSGQVTTAVVEMVHSFSPEIGFFANNVTVAQSNSAASPVPNGTEQESLMSFVKR
jgi:hypothetical protein